ncbi:hypothetical protein [Peribacillus butanolivorans]|uniref:hypothetical protein n=1 Tax=Peribacillus butanolivorans TaxID=421767 RepID=UPI00364A971A
MQKVEPYVWGNMGAENRNTALQCSIHIYEFYDWGDRNSFISDKKRKKPSSNTPVLAFFFQISFLLVREHF